MKIVISGVMGLMGWGVSIGFTLLIIGAIAAALVYDHYNSQLPDHTQLASYDPPTLTRLYADNGKLMAEYATEKRVFVPLSVIPKRVINAFLSAEDKNFYSHDGIDITGILRAVRDNIINYGKGRSLVGGSTITQQVVKNFLLSNEKSIERKIKEAILALRISRIYSKDKILELYLNEIYLGLGSYGVASASLNYFNKSMDALTVSEAALLAAMPKGPSLYNPHKNYKRAKKRRDWVINKMHDEGYITDEVAEEAKNADIILHKRRASQIAKASFFSEEVRRTLVKMYGSDVLYKGGLVVKTTLVPETQDIADRALRSALISYDRKRGYRGPIDSLVMMGAKPDDWKEQLVKLRKKHRYHMLKRQRLALVTMINYREAIITFSDGSEGVIPQSLLKWTRRITDKDILGAEVKKPADIFKIGDVVLVGPLSKEQKTSLSSKAAKKAWDLQQIPEVNGAMVVLNPHNGRVLAMSGGYSYGATEFNRATQARRQPGSVFKPFVYMSALENGFTPSTIILDAPLEISQGEGKPVWKPQNYHDDYLGPTTMRVGLERSRNTMTVRMAQIIGLEQIMEISRRFRIYDRTPPNLSMVLGAGETTLLRLVNAYGMIVNGGKRITPSLIERIDDRNGKIIYRRDSRDCINCVFTDDVGMDRDARPPIPIDIREQVIDPRVAYQMVSMLRGVATRGTGARSNVIGRTIAGKTGTTNSSVDTWFIGFSPDLVVGVYIGFDKPRTLGVRSTGSSVALPAFISFMQEALKGEPNRPFRVPPGIRLQRVDLYSGLSNYDALNSEVRVISEAFITGGPIYRYGQTNDSSGIQQRTGRIGMGNYIKPAMPENPDSTFVSDSELPTVSPEIPVIQMPSNRAHDMKPPVMGTGGLY